MQKKGKNALIVWLLTGCAMVFGMFIIGAITRLTGSGLSIVEWKLIMGMIPPMNEQEWTIAFEKYRQFPQFSKLNADMTLAGFKNIFFWEYLHRLWGRLIGVVFVVPFIVFWIKGYLNKRLSIQLLIVFALGALQAMVGWIMVKSGLIDQPWVSPYKLTAHLMTALLLFGYMLWITYEIIFESNRPEIGVPLKRFSGWLTAIICVQIFFGGFMSGTKAGLFFPTFPTMNGAWIPENLFSQSPAWINLFENVATIQFVHRGLAYLIVVLGIVLWLKVQQLQVQGVFRKYANSLLLLIGIQVLLGIFTVIYCHGSVPVALGTLHQAGALLLLTNSLLLNFLSQKKRIPV